MKQFLRGFNIYHIFILAFIVRLILLPVAFHSDLTTNSIWGIYAKEFGLRGYYDWLNFGNYARPEYPPFSTILFLFIRTVWQGIFNALWFLNVNIQVFPSNLVSWFDSFGNLLLLKIPGILADIGIGYLIFQFTKSKRLASFYLFNPAVVYLSAVWGQTESFVGFFAIAGLIFLIQKRYLASFLGFFISFMTKATMLPLAPIILFTAVRQRIKPKDLIKLLVLSLILLYFVGYFFTDHAYLSWVVNSYLTKFMVGPYNLGYINLNAFNFWDIVLGLERIPDSTVYLGISLRSWAWLISLPIFTFILARYKNPFFAALMLFYASFLFLPRMHERYFYPVFVFFPFVLSKFPKLKNLFYLSSLIFAINLYHWWSVPYIAGIFNFFDLELVERSLSTLNVGVFGYILWNYRSS